VFKNNETQMGEGGGLPWCYTKALEVRKKIVTAGRERVKKTSNIVLLYSWLAS
jgi:hypothetical protein